ncbi:MAG: glycosyltransferase [Planctomycetota bacterium]|nr:MAG: glycosyltransferase [Planctomycetota bacterium]
MASANTTDQAKILDAQLIQTANEYDRWRKRNSYYYRELIRLYKRHVPEGARVLEIGCEAGDLLAGVKPTYGVGIDENPQLIELARQRHPELDFHAGTIEQIPQGETFDFVLICNAVDDMRDVQAIFSVVKRFCRPETRIILTYHNALWEPILTLASKLQLRRPVGQQNWLSRDDLANLFDLAGYQVVRQFCEVLFPKFLPLVSGLCNRFLVKFWPWKHLALVILVVARPLVEPIDDKKAAVSVIIPTRNERGNVESIIQRTPDMGTGTELIFVDGWSTDGTQDEIKRCIETYPDKTIRFIPQQGRKGKGQAVRQGFDAAQGEVLMILDADMTVAPEDLPKFYNALAEGKGEFINGTRLVYPMEEKAMRFLNKCGNRFFSLLFTWLIGQRFRDTLCGTKVLTKQNYQRIAAGRAYFGEFDPFGDFDLIFGAAKNDLKIIEIPVRYGARIYGETSISRFRDGWLLLKMSWVAFWKLRLR